MDTHIGDTIRIVNPRKPYLRHGEIYTVVGHTRIMGYPYVMACDGRRRYIGADEYELLWRGDE